MTSKVYMVVYNGSVESHVSYSYNDLEEAVDKIKNLNTLYNMIGEVGTYTLKSVEDKSHNVVRINGETYE